LRQTALNITIFFLALLSTNQVQGQDLHYSQFYGHQLFLNPALNTSTDCGMRAGLIYRDQWNRFNSPFKTMSAYFEGIARPSFLMNDFIGFGAFVFQDVGGDGSLKATGGQLNFSFKHFLGYKRDTVYVSLGVGVGGTQRSVDFTRLTFASQWNGVNISPNLPPELASQNNKKGFLNLDFGMVFFYSKYDVASKRSKYNFQLGAGISHLNQPDISFLNNNEKLHFKINVHGRFTGNINRKMKFMPGFLYSNQQPYNEIVVGADFRQSLQKVSLSRKSSQNKHSSSFSVTGGIWFRFSELRDIIPKIIFSMNGFDMGLSYDISLLNKYGNSPYRGGFEISLSKNFNCNERWYKWGSDY
jgi:type IX secretion system PorP/SprF family membrane protein